MSFGFDDDDFTEDSLEDSVFNFGETGNKKETSEESEETQGYYGMTTEVNMDDDEKKKKKKISIILLLVGFVAILIASAIIGAQRKKEENGGSTIKSNKNQETQESNVQSDAGNTQGQSSSVLVVDNGWTKIDYTAIELSQQIKGTFTVTDKQYFAKKTGDSTTKLELNVRATGEISGLTGSYTLDIPWRVAELINLGDVIDVYYYIGEINGNRVVLDISYNK